MTAQQTPNRLNLLLDNPSGPDGRFNVGDDIQTIAASQFMPAIDRLVRKEELSKYGGPPGRIILNGWFMHRAENWPPPEQIAVLMTSMHISPPAASGMLSHRGLSYMKAHGPVGCRDQSTVDLLARHGVESYLSGCLTLTLERSRFVSEARHRQGIFAVDLLYKLDDELRRASWHRKLLLTATASKRRLAAQRRAIVDAFVGRSDRSRVQTLHHGISLKTDSHEARWEHGMRLLRMYANAELVITSRIHCALPCLAFDTPVIFVDSALEDRSERARLDSLLELFHVARMNGDRVILDSSMETSSGGTVVFANKPDYKKYRDGLLSQCRGFIDREVG